MHNLLKQKNDQYQEAWNIYTSPRHSFGKEKPDCTNRFSDVETMKVKFAKLLLGEDFTGGTKGVSTALGLSRAITSLAASVFGELWKLEPLAEERKRLWRREMDWLLSPTNYMVELVPAKQTGIHGGTLEIMTPKARGDVHMNLPALQKLDSMLIELAEARKKKRKKHYSLEQELAVLWEKMRRRNIAKDDRSMLVSEALRKMKEKISEIASSHVSSRVLQTCVKHCTQDERNAVFVELRPCLISLATNTYAVHLVIKMLDNVGFLSSLGSLLPIYSIPLDLNGRITFRGVTIGRFGSHPYYRGYNGTRWILRMT